MNQHPFYNAPQEIASHKDEIAKLEKRLTRHKKSLQEQNGVIDRAQNKCDVLLSALAEAQHETPVNEDKVAEQLLAWQQADADVTGQTQLLSDMNTELDSILNSIKAQQGFLATAEQKGRVLEISTRIIELETEWVGCYDEMLDLLLALRENKFNRAFFNVSPQLLHIFRTHGAALR